MSGMSPVAADFASAESAPTDPDVVVVEREGAEEAGGWVEDLLEFDDPEDPQPAASAVTAAQRAIIAGRRMAGILRGPPENVLNTTSF